MKNRRNINKNYLQNAQNFFLFRKTQIKER